MNIAKAALPLTPRFVLQKSPTSCYGATSPYGMFADLLRCADDGRDHRECCIRSRVPTDCLSMCSGGKVTNSALCSVFAPRAVACMMRGHERAPSPPVQLRYEYISPESVKVSFAFVVNHKHFLALLRALSLCSDNKWSAKDE
ncbi:unnamed protein product [Gongylonema pulchrum]|uniref:Domain of unknown function DB domain-containing protein n=1 Tax=Gongylonema pulchrum TaxID=637853 RepID=A0A3P7RNT8_9BILA|nr:unnamed protein product [Gongylonema pulchrum]